MSQGCRKGVARPLKDVARTARSRTLSRTRSRTRSRRSRPRSMIALWGRPPPAISLTPLTICSRPLKAGASLFVNNRAASAGWCRTAGGFWELPGASGCFCVGFWWLPEASCGFRWLLVASCGFWWRLSTVADVPALGHIIWLGLEGLHEDHRHGVVEPEEHSHLFDGPAELQNEL